MKRSSRPNNKGRARSGYSAQERTCRNCSNEFAVEPQDFDFYGKIAVPPPTWCPKCRMVRRLAWQGYQHLHHRTCDFTGETVISTHHPDSPHKVYRQDIWWSDKWSAFDYGRDIDWDRPFIEQFAELMRDVPFPALYTEYTTMVRSDYCNAASGCKNCYLCFRITNGEDCGYVNLVSNLKDCLDCSYNRKDTLSYGNVITHSSYRSFFCEDVVGSQDMWFCRSCVGCHDCVATANVTKKQYLIFGEQKTKGEYEKIFETYDFGSMRSLTDFQKRATEYLDTQPRKHFNDRMSTNTTGEYIYNSKNVHDSYMIRKAQDIRYCQFLKGGPATDCYDYSLFGEEAELIYESTWVGMSARNVKFSVWNYGVNDIEFSFGCHGSNNMFGCAGIRNGEYCILNKRYAKTEYMDLTARIRKQMQEKPYKDRLGRTYSYGEMLPPELSPWAYNESTAQEWFPMTKEETEKQGYTWRDPDPKQYGKATTEIPDHIRDVTDEILEGILRCETCEKNYRLIKPELDFYRRFNLPVPRLCFMCRDRSRTGKLNSLEIYERTCDKCGREVKSSWKPGGKEIIYCTPCYQKHVV